MTFVKKNENTLIIATLVLINFIIKGLYLSNNSLAGDEPFSVYHAQMDVVSIIKILSEGNNPPLYEILLSGWIKLFGISEFAVRFPSLIFSSITVIYIYKFALTFINKRVAIYAGILFIFSNYQILFAQEARVYALLGLLSIASMYYYMRVMRFCFNSLTIKEEIKPNIRINIASLLITNTLIIYAHYFGCFILFIQFLFFISNRAILLKNWKYLILSISIICLLFTPNLLVLINRFLDSSSNGTWLESPNGIESIYNMIWKFSNAPVVASIVIVLLVSAIVKYLIKRKAEQKNKGIMLVVFWFTFLFFFMFGISYIIPMFIDRYLMPVSIAFCLLLATSADYLVQKHKFRYIIPGFILLLFTLTVKINISNKRNVKETVAQIVQLKDRQTLVIICPHHFTLNFMYYYDQTVFKDFNTSNIYFNIDKALHRNHIFGINNIKEIDINKWKKIVFLDAAASFTYPNNGIQQELEAKFEKVNSYHFYEIFNVTEYTLK